MSHIFMSYSRQDDEFVEKLICELGREGFDTWRDVEQIRAGAEWRAAISEAIRECRCFIVVLSPQCITSKNVTKELSIAESHHKPIIPILHQSCEISSLMEYQLAGIQWIDFVELSYDAALERLLMALGREKSGAQSYHSMPSTTPLTSAAAAQSVSPAKALPKFCIHCGTPLRADKAFCIGCGRRLAP